MRKRVLIKMYEGEKVSRYRSIDCFFGTIRVSPFFFFSRCFVGLFFLRACCFFLPSLLHLEMYIRTSCSPLVSSCACFLSFY